MTPTGKFEDQTEIDLRKVDCLRYSPLINHYFFTRRCNNGKEEGKEKSD